MMTRLFFLRAAVAAAVLLVWLSAGAGVGAQETPRDPSTTADAPGTPSGATLPDGLGTFLDGYAAAHLADRYPPALMVAVATADETLIRVYGTADAATGAPATPDTLFRIASISKTFVWTAVMILADEGKLDLDADVNTLQSAVTIPEAFGAPVTLNDIMAHRGGFEDTFGVFVGADSGLTAGALLDRARPERVAPPGERTAYSNWATTLAAVIVETAAGQPFEDFVAERLLAPLAMTSTALRDPQSAPERALNDLALDARTAAPHVQEAGAASAVVHDRLEPVFAAGAASLSARDAAKWMQFFLRRGRAPDGAPILSTKTFETMRTRQFNDRPDAPDFAHGFMEAEIAGLPTYGHAGTLSGFIAEMRIVPDLGIGVFVAVNGAERIRLPDLVARAVIEFAARAPLYAAPVPGPDDPAAVDRAKSVAGVYRSARRVETKFEKLFALGGETTVKAMDDGSLLIGKQRYYPYKEDVWTDRSRDRIHVSRDADGAVSGVSVRMGTDTLIPVGFFRSSAGANTAVGLAYILSITAFLGLWRRLAVRAPGATNPGRALAIGQIATAVAVIAFVGTAAGATAALSGATLTDLMEKGYPPPALNALRLAGLVAAFALATNALASPLVWTTSGWSVWRKLHHALFAAAGVWTIWALFDWRVIFAPTAAV